MLDVHVLLIKTHTHTHTHTHELDEHIAMWSIIGADCLKRLNTWRETAWVVEIES